MTDYDLLAGYVHDMKGLRWSYPEIKGRPSDWADDAARLPLTEELAAAAAAGFTGVYVDRDGYQDNGNAVVAQLDRQVGARQQISSANGRLAFYSLAPLAARLRASISPGVRAAAGSDLTHPIDVEFGSGLLPEENDASGPFRWSARTATITLRNRWARARTVFFDMRLAPGPGASSRWVTVASPAGRRTLVATAVHPAHYRALVNVPARGSAAVRLSVSGSAAPDGARVVRVIAPTASDPAIVAVGEVAKQTKAG